MLRFRLIAFGDIVFFFFLSFGNMNINYLPLNINLF